MAERLILKSFQSPGDVVMLTATVRDLHAAYPGRYQTDVRTAADDLWKHNPHVAPLREEDADVRTLKMHYPLVNQSNQRPFHFIHGYTQFLEEKLGLSIPITRFCGDVYLSDEEKAAPPAGVAGELPERYWIVVAGGKYDFTAKWWNPASFQQVVDHFQGRISFVQCGEAGHWHPPLEGVVDLVGRSSLREFICLMYHAEGVLCPVTFAMHLAAAVESKPGERKLRPCVVVAGGREPPQWEAYPHHQYLSTIGMLDCCATGGCWRSRCQPVGDGDAKDRSNVCDRPVEIGANLSVPECMEMITPADVIRRIEMYCGGNGHSQDGGHSQAASERPVIATEALPVPMEAVAGQPQPPRRKISVAFYHGLGDCAYFAHLLPLYTQRGYEVEVECTPDKAILFRAAGARVITSGAQAEHPWGYPSGGTHAGHGRFWLGSKMAHNISQPPLPDIGNTEDLWDEYCASRIEIRPCLSSESVEIARQSLRPLKPPVVLLHTKGNTGQSRKSLPDAIALEFYKSLIDVFDGTLVLLDWDNRVPRLASYRVRHLDDLGPCPTDVLLALMGEADLMVGVDSGPLHAARFTDVPTVGLWMPGHYPSTYSLPRKQQVNVVLAEPTRPWNRYKRIPWNVYEHPGRTFDPQILADVCRRMLAPPRYLPSDQTAADVQMQQFVSRFCRGASGNTLSGFSDRNRSFDVLLREASRRFSSPIIVETGTIRAEEDWGGAGFFTYLAGAYLQRLGGTLHTVDVNPSSCQFAREWTAVFGDTVHVHQQDSVQFLREFPGKIDVLFLDSLDTTEPGHAQHGLAEVQAGLPKLHAGSIIVLDDTPWNSDAFTGKGALAVPWLLNNGWEIGYAGYQVVLWQEGSH